MLHMLKIMFCIYQILHYKHIFKRERIGGEDLEATYADILPSVLQ